MTNITQLVPTKSDAELANDFKLRLIEAVKPQLTILTEINKAGFIVSMGTGINAFGEAIVIELTLLKKY